MHRVIHTERILKGTNIRSLNAHYSSSKIKSPKIDNMREGWDAYSLLYATNIEGKVLPSQMTLMNELAPGDKDLVLEAACGSGLFGAYHCISKPTTQKYHMIDLSPKMVNLASLRLAASLKSGKIVKDVSSLELGTFGGNDREFLANNGIDIRAGNCEDLSHLYDDHTVDVFIGGLFVHLVPNPQIILQEAFRILKKGGRIGFSVFGAEENSLYFTLFDELIAKETKVEFKSKFHLNDTTKLTEMLIKTGFKHPRFMRQDLSFGIRDPSEADEHFTMPANQAILSKFSQEGKEELKGELRNKFKTTLDTSFIGIQTLLVTATK